MSRPPPQNANKSQTPISALKFVIVTMFGTRRIIAGVLEAVPFFYYGYKNKLIFEGKMDEIAQNFFDNFNLGVIGLFALFFILIFLFIFIRTLKTP
uniref:DUF3817 domain-containing protein n=1 Tax=Panagrellus redivivus TaxID=6233 RepID=A0A7E4VAT5_PANRE